MKRRNYGIFTRVCIFFVILLLCRDTVATYAVDTVSDYTGTNYIHDSAFDDRLLVNGIDASVYQKNVDWKAVKASGIDFVILRVGGRGYGPEGVMYDDKEFAAHYKGAKEAGLMVGIYFFSQATTVEEAKEEVEYAVTLLEGRQLDLPFYMDYEFSGENGGRVKLSGITKIEATEVAKAFMDEVKKRGYKTGIYANKNFLSDTVYGEALGEYYDIWIAQYYNKVVYNGKYNMWQYSSKGKVPGISSNADCNFWYLEKGMTATSDKSVVNAEVAFANPELSYSYLEGAAFRPIVTVKVGDKTLAEGVDYNVGYLHNTMPGTAYIMVSGIGEYTDYKLYPFQIAPTLGSGHSISGTIRSHGTSKKEITRMQLTVEGDKSPWYEWTMTGFEGDYKLPDLPDGKYTLTITKRKHIPETVEIFVEGNDVLMSPSIYAYGDINKDGEVNERDAHVIAKQNVYAIPLTDKYQYRLKIKKSGG